MNFWLVRAKDFENVAFQVSWGSKNRGIGVVAEGILMAVLW